MTEMRNALAYVQIALGTLVSALAINLFLVPTQLPSGGLGGLMLIMNYLWQIPVGPAYFVANIPAILWLFKVKGRQGAVKSLWGIACFSLLVQVTAPLSVYAPTQNLVLAAIFAGALLGIGTGLTLVVGGDTGGNSTYARMIRHYTGLNVSTVMLGMDAVILGFGATMLSVEPVLFALIMTVVCSYCVGLVQDGLNSSRFVLIISEQVDLVGTALLGELKRGVTRLDARGEYTGKSRPVLMVVVSPPEVMRVKRLVLETDPEAFMMVSDAREVSGRGFTLEHELRRLPYWAAQSGD
ncbi:MAG: hypothetical protein K0R39_4174 [Symbiobacteriaceae bacterium]|jgi:uncharacterized membrane-anchored protein YitT (DUF2179 family)|nr:hypothetical protein [Symbiobacteriaceae bacterium]